MLGDSLLFACLAVSVAAAGINDSFQTPIVLTGETPVSTEDFTGAGVEQDEPAHGFGASLWWEWTATFSGGVAVGITADSTASPAAVVFKREGPGFEMTSSPIPSAVLGFNYGYNRVSFRAEAGVKYLIGAVAFTNQVWGNITVSIRPGPGNDDFDKAQTLVGDGAELSVTMHGATSETGEQPASTNGVGASLWWKWSPGRAGRFNISADPSGSRHIRVYRGSKLDNLSLVAAAGPELGGGTHLVHDFHDEFYYVTTQGAATTPASFTLRIQPSMPNDDFSQRSLFSGRSVVTNINVLPASREAGEPTPVVDYGSIWWEWTAPFSGGVALEISGSSFFPWLCVFTGSSLTNLVAISSPFPSSSRAGFRAHAGTTYYLAAIGLRPGSLKIELKPGPANDDFENALVLGAASETIDGSFHGATAQPAEPILATNDFGASVWYRWVPPAHGLYSFGAGSISDACNLGIFRGTTLSSLERLSFAESTNDQRQVRLSLRADSDPLYIRVGTRTPFLSNFSLDIRQHPPNDDRTNALELKLGTIVTNDLAGASREPGEVWGDLAEGTVWYFWRAPTSGNYLFTFDASSCDLNVGIFEHTNLVTSVAWWGRSPGTIVFEAKEGITYHFACSARLDCGGNRAFTSIFPGHPHDTVATAEPLAGEFVAWTNSTLGATSEPGEFSGPRASSWARWRAPRSGPYGLIRSDNTVEVFAEEGTRLISRQNLHRIKFDAVEGVEYLLRFETETNGMAKSLVLLGPLPANDDFAAPAELFGTNLIVRGWTWTATPGTNEIERSIWWKWMAPADGLLNLATTNSAEHVILDVLHSKSPTLGREVSRSQIAHDLRYVTRNQSVVQKGVEYLFRVASRMRSADIDLRLEFSPRDELPHQWKSTFPGYLRGGEGLWIAEGSALRAALAEFGQSAWIETTYSGPGQLSFWWKVNEAVPGNWLIFANSTLQAHMPSDAAISTNWAEQKILLKNATNTVRWIFERNNPRGGDVAWLSNVVFTPTPPEPLTLSFNLVASEAFRLTVPVEAQRIFTIEHSTDLIQWLALTNFFSSKVTTCTFEFSIATNGTAQFFRAMSR